jgi:hypothetical protein
MADWISVKDKLPARGVRVFVANRSGEVSTGVYIPSIMFWELDSETMDDDIVLWMPVPGLPDINTT